MRRSGRCQSARDWAAAWPGGASWTAPEGLKSAARGAGGLLGLGFVERLARRRAHRLRLAKHAPRTQQRTWTVLSAQKTRHRGAAERARRLKRRPWRLGFVTQAGIAHRGLDFSLGHRNFPIHACPRSGVKRPENKPSPAPIMPPARVRSWFALECPRIAHRENGSAGRAASRSTARESSAGGRPARSTVGQAGACC